MGQYEEGRSGVMTAQRSRGCAVVYPRAELSPLQIGRHLGYAAAAMLTDCFCTTPPLSHSPLSLTLHS